MCHPHAIHFMNCVTESNSEMEQPTTAIKYQFAPTPINLLPVGCLYFVAQRPPTGVRQKVRYILWGRLCNLYTYINSVNKHTHKKE